MDNAFQEYSFPVLTNFDKRHIIFGRLNEIELWCFEKFGIDSHIKVVSVQADWRLTYKFKHKEHAVLFALRWI